MIANPHSSAPAPRHRLLAAICASALLALGLAGCGGDESSPDEQRAEAVVRAFVNAANERDFESVCGLLTTEARKQEVGAAGPQRCIEALRATEGLEEPGDIEVDVQDVRINADRAAVEVKVRNSAEETTGQSLQLVRGEGGWLISEID